ncbi:MAG: radical SAM protein [Gemmatimonadaceae bacterium]
MTRSAQPAHGIAGQEQLGLFRGSSGGGSRRLPVIAEQTDITYHSAPARSILNGPETTGMGFWSINPYIGCAFGCTYCYARYTHRYAMERATAHGDVDGALASDIAGMPPWLAFERHIVVKTNAAESLRKTLRSGSNRYRALMEGDSVVIGTATDPYQPAERKFRITRGILETLAQFPGMDICVITKSPLITRDVDLLSRIAERSEVSVHISLITLDRALARRIEPRAPTPDSRLRAIKRLREAGIDASINCMPVLPGITDDPAALEALVRSAAEAGATNVSACALRLRDSARQRYLPFIEQEFPHLAARYNRAYSRGYNVSTRYREGLEQFFEAARRKYGVGSRQSGVGSREPETPNP